VLRQPRPRGVAGHPRREDSRPPLPAADREPAPRRLPRGLALRPHPERVPARGRGQPDPGEHLPRRTRRSPSGGGAPAGGATGWRRNGCTSS
jgi:hypothetical protein